MARFSIKSLIRLHSCDPRLRRLFTEVVKEIDCTILEGFRTRRRQRELFREGKSRVALGKHNSYPSLAVDVAPCPIDWDDVVRFEWFALHVMEKARELDIRIRWGGDWSMQWDGRSPRPQQRFDDLVHFELMEPAA